MPHITMHKMWQWNRNRRAKTDVRCTTTQGERLHALLTSLTEIWGAGTASGKTWVRKKKPRTNRCVPSREPAVEKRRREPTVTSTSLGRRSRKVFWQRCVLHQCRIAPFRDRDFDFKSETGPRPRPSKIFSRSRCSKTASRDRLVTQTSCLPGTLDLPICNLY